MKAREEKEENIMSDEEREGKKDTGREGRISSEERREKRKK